MDESDNQDILKELELIVESLLFSSERPLTIKELTGILTEHTYSEIKSALQLLLNRYQELNRSFELVEVAGGYQFRTKPGFGPYIQRLFRASPYRLSEAAMETLAIVAYKQPVSKNDIESIRGVDVSHILKVLIEKGLIRVVGRSDQPGRPLLYGTTKRFLEVFGLKDLSCLPELEELKEGKRLFRRTISEMAQDERKSGEA